MIADFVKQKVSDTDPKAVQKIDFARGINQLCY